MIVLKQISVKSTNMIITIFPVWSSIINALLGTQINVNICVVKPSKVHFIAVYSYMGLYDNMTVLVEIDGQNRRKKNCLKILKK